MPYGFSTDKRGNRHFGRVAAKAAKAVVDEAPLVEEAVEEPVEAVAVEAPKPKVTRKKKAASDG